MILSLLPQDPCNNALELTKKPIITIKLLTTAVNCQ